jgi:DNA-directed RNA polymerase subunit RPC12/RpoP
LKWKISKKSVTCAKCGNTLSQDEVKRIRSGVPTSCRSCGHTIIINRHLNSLEQDDRDEGRMVHPVGRLSIGQKAQPLDIETQKFGDADDNESHDYFAPATFQELPDSEKLDAPSFEKMCPYCGHANKSGKNVCESCGASI